MDDLEYYLADGSGAPVCSDGEFLKIYDEKGSCRSLTWTISNYLSINNLHASKARLYCVEKIPSKHYPKVISW